MKLVLKDACWGIEVLEESNVANIENELQALFCNVGKYGIRMHGFTAYTWGADKSLARPTSQWRRTESIVSVERGYVHVLNCKSLLDTKAERKHVRRCARFQQQRDVNCHQVFFLQGKAPKEIHPILI